MFVQAESGMEVKKGGGMEYNMWYIWCIEDKYVEYIHRALKGSSGA